MNIVEAGFWFLSGFMLASWLSWRSHKRQRDKALDAFRAYKAEVHEMLKATKAVTEVNVTIIDNDLELETEEEDPPAALSSRPRKDLH